MAREIYPREDLLRDAAALVERAALRIEGEIEPVLIGFRREGGASVYFGEEPVLHFNERGELRRAFIGDRQYRADRGRWSEARRSSEEGRVRVARISLDAAENELLHRQLCERLRDCRAAIASGAYAVEGQVPPDGDIVGRIARWIASLPEELIIAERL